MENEELERILKELDEMIWKAFTIHLKLRDVREKLVFMDLKQSKGGAEGGT